MTVAGRASRAPRRSGAASGLDGSPEGGGTVANDAVGNGPRDVRGGGPQRSRARRWGGRVLWGLALAVIVAVPWWGRAVLQRLDFFQVRTVEVQGARYLDPAAVVQRLNVDTLHSVWDELAPLAQRLRTDPLIEDVSVDRRLPGTLVVRLTERTPVAFVATGNGLQLRDAEGNVLPIDPNRTPVDLPVIASPDTAVLRLLGELRTAQPEFYGRLSEVQHAGPHELIFRLYTTTVRARTDVDAQRFGDLKLVEDDLAQREQRAVELDLRFRDQVIARLP